MLWRVFFFAFFFFVDVYKSVNPYATVLTCLTVQLENQQELVGKEGFFDVLVMLKEECPTKYRPNMQLFLLRNGLSEQLTGRMSCLLNTPLVMAL